MQRHRSCKKRMKYCIISIQIFLISETSVLKVKSCYYQQDFTFFIEFFYISQEPLHSFSLIYLNKSLFFILHSLPSFTPFISPVLIFFRTVSILHLSNFDTSITVYKLSNSIVSPFVSFILFYIILCLSSNSNHDNIKISKRGMIK